MFVTYFLWLAVSALMPAMKYMLKFMIIFMVFCIPLKDIADAIASIAFLGALY